MTIPKALLHFRPLYGVAVAAAAALPADASSAQVVQRFSLAVDGTGGFATNPFLGEGEDNSASFVEVGVAPEFILQEERGSIRLQANARGTQYLERFGSSYSLSTRLAADRRLSEELTIRAEASAESSVVGERSGDFADPFSIGDDLGEQIGDLPEDSADELFDPLDPDLGLLGRRARRNSLNAEVGVDYRPYPEDRLRVTLQAARSSFPGRQAVTLRNVSGSLFYARSVGAGASIGISSSVEHTSFGQGLGSSTVYQPQLSYSGLVYPGWQFTISGGASIVRFNSGAGRSNRTTGLAGEVSTCRKGVRLQMCLSASHGAEESARGSVGKRTSVSGELSYTLSERETIGVTGSLGKIEQSLNVVGIADEDVRQQSLRADYRLRLRERWDIGVTAGYRDLYRAGRPIDPDFSVTATLRVGLER